MIAAEFSYAAPGDVLTDRERTTLALSADAGRPVRFRGRLREGALYLRLALQALASVHRSDERHDAYEWSDGLLDPVVTVHPDRLVFETFSRDAGVYGAALLDRDLFEPDGEVACGTTNVEFTSWLSGALGELRSSRSTWLTIQAAPEFPGRRAGLTRKLELPEARVRGLLRVQEAMAFAGTRVAVRPVDLLKAIRYLQFARGKLSPRALRWEFEPDQPPRMVLEPWEEAIVCKNSSHAYAERRVVRTWGRGRLRLLEPLLGYADVIDAYLKGRGLPSFYVAHLPGVRFLLGLSGWTRQSWSGGSGFESLTRRDGRDLALVEPALAYLRDAHVATVDDVAAAVGCDWDAARRLLVRLCRQGRVMYDLERRNYRHRELFREPIDEVAFPPDAQSARGLEYVTRRQVEVTHTEARETCKRKVLWTPGGKVTRDVVFHDWVAQGMVAGQGVEIVLNEEGKIIFGKCGCAFFRDNILNQGPCEHMIALLEVSAERRAPADSGNEALSSPGEGPPTVDP
jgi:hypothetical protein